MNGSDCQQQVIDIVVTGDEVTVDSRDDSKERIHSFVTLEKEKFKMEDEENYIGGLAQ
jgi:hypothetical protein